MRRTILFALLFLIFIPLSACGVREYAISPPKEEIVMINDNYRVYYEIFVGAFSDGSGDGMGDLKGIIHRLDYLNDGDFNSGLSLGITGLWLMPIMPSPSYHKYDTTNYKAIDPQYGTLEDFKTLVTEAQKRNIDIIIDLVVNHTSIHHPWFREARKAAQEGRWDSPYLDYYTLVKEEEKVPGRTYYLFHDDLYYEGNFWSQMPELNVASPHVRSEFEDIISFWLDLGVKGFRLDAVKYLYFGELEPNILFWEWFMDTVTAIREDAYVVGEMWASDAEILPYYAVFNNFDFGMSQNNGAVVSTVQGIESVNAFVQYITSYKERVKAVNETAILQPFISNHDMNRAAGYLNLNGPMQMAANLYILTYGTPFIYYGEEIGMRGSRGNENTDANRRLAMLWGDNDKVKDPVGAFWTADQQTNGTVRNQINDPYSLLTHYKKLIQARHAHPEIARGEYTALEFAGFNNFGGFISTLNDSSVVVLHHTGNETLTIDLRDYGLEYFTRLTAELGLPIKTSNGSFLATLDGSILTIAPKTSVILR